jgi:hypothetical protein
VTEIDAATATVVGAPIPVGSDPYSLSADGTDVWVANSNSPFVSDISSAPTDVTYVPTNATAGAIAAWTLGFTSSSAGELAGSLFGTTDSIAAVFPASVKLPAHPVVDLQSGFSGTCSNPRAERAFGVLLVVALPPGCDLAPSTPATVTIDGITNPSARTIKASKFAIDTSEDPRFVSPTQNVVIQPTP